MFLKLLNSLLCSSIGALNVFLFVEDSVSYWRESTVRVAKVLCFSSLFTGGLGEGPKPGDTK